MTSKLITDFFPSTPPLPVERFPRETLVQTRAEWISFFNEGWPAAPGITMEKANCDGVDAVWYRPGPKPSERVILYVHGGGFMWSSAEDHQGVISRIAIAANCDSIALDYKVAPFAPFPGPIEEGVILYRWMLANGYESSKIAIAGDSAGGGLALSLLHALEREGLPTAGCAAVTSSYIDLTNQGESIDWVDDPCVTRTGLEICAEAYLQGRDPADPLASALFGDLSKFPPVLLQVGSREQLLSDSTRFAAKAEASGVDATLEVYSGCMHLWHWWVPESPESHAAIASIARFIDEKLA